MDDLAEHSRTNMDILLGYEAGRRDTLHDALESAKTMTREMLIQWLESEIENS